MANTPRNAVGRHLGRGAVVVLVCVFALTTAALGGGPQLADNSARANGMAGATIASADDPTGATLNPAGLSFLSGMHLSFGVTLSLPDYRFTGVAPSTATTKMLSQVIFPPNFSFSYGAPSGFALGISAAVPYILTTGWPSDWTGARIATGSEFRSVFISPNVAFRISPDLSVGVGLNFVASRLRLSQRIGFDSSQVDGSVTYQGDSQFGYGVQAGLLYRPGKSWSLGASYRSQVSIHVNNAQVTFDGIPAPESALYPDGQASMSTNTPADIRLGLGWRPFSAFLLEADAQYVFWSAFATLPITSSNSGLRDTVLQEQWKDTFSFRFGMEYAFTDITFRGGVLLDQSPVPDPYLRPSLPDADKVGYTAGIGYGVGAGLRLDFAYMYLSLRDRRVTSSQVDYLPGMPFNGTYTGFVSVVGLNVTYSWD